MPHFYRSWQTDVGSHIDKIQDYASNIEKKLWVETYTKYKYKEWVIKNFYDILDTKLE
jgi:hypothetical protein